MNQSRPNRPPEGSYIPLARRVLTAQTLKKRAADDELEAKRACAKAMSSVNVSQFSFSVDNEVFTVKLERPWAKRVNVRKLYVLVASGEISLDMFLDCITSSEDAVVETLGEDFLSRVVEDYKKGLDLIIEPLDT